MWLVSRCCLFSRLVKKIKEKNKIWRCVFFLFLLPANLWYITTLCVHCSRTKRSRRICRLLIASAVYKYTIVIQPIFLHFHKLSHLSACCTCFHIYVPYWFHTLEAPASIFQYRGVHPPDSHDATFSSHFSPSPLPPLSAPYFNGGPGLRGYHPEKMFGIKDKCRWVLEYFKHRLQHI